MGYEVEKTTVIKDINSSSESFLASKNSIDRLEISVRSACGKMCDYCPQDRFITSYKKSFQGDVKILTLESFKKMAKNIPTSTQLRWTGFTEPFDFAEFPEVVQYLNERGYSQVISTTLLGPAHSQIFFIENLKIFKDGITLHLPDDEGLMKGRFNEKYAVYVEKVLERLGMDELKYDVFLIGDRIHQSIADIVERFVQKHQVFGAGLVKAKYLNTRVGAIDASMFKLNSSDFVKKEGAKYHCAYRRLNQGVLLPNGAVALCCQDYGLEFILGNLKDTPLSSLYQVIEGDVEIRNRFESGQFSPCVRCEHYRPIDAATTTNRT